MNSTTEMKFPSIEVNTASNIQLSYIFDTIFGEENSIDSIERRDDRIYIHFNQDLPMTPKIEEFYTTLRETGKIKSM
jgi:hypothetical protein